MLQKIQTILFPFDICPGIFRILCFFQLHYDHSTVLISASDACLFPFFFPFLPCESPGKHLIKKQKFPASLSCLYSFCFFDAFQRLLYFSCNLVLSFSQKLVKCLFIQCILQDILICSLFHGFFYIFKFIMTAQNDNVNISVRFSDLAYQLNSIHQRHGNICNYQVKLFFFQTFQRFFSVTHICRYHKTRFFPGWKHFQITSYQIIIIYQ